MKLLKKYLKKKSEIESDATLPEERKKTILFNTWLDYVTEYSKKNRGLHSLKKNCLDQY